MPTPLSISFLDMDSTPALEDAVRARVAKLEHFYDRIERCDVVIDRPHQHHHQGQQFRVRLTLAVPGSDIVVSRHHARDGAHEDAYVAIHDAFRAARRQLEVHVQRRRPDGLAPREAW